MTCEANWLDSGVSLDKILVKINLKQNTNVC